MNPNYNEPGKRETARLAKLEKTNPAKAAHQRILNRINRRLSRPWFDRICGWCGREYNQLDAGTRRDHCSDECFQADKFAAETSQRNERKAREAKNARRASWACNAGKRTRAEAMRAAFDARLRSLLVGTVPGQWISALDAALALGVKKDNATNWLDKFVSEGIAEQVRVKPMRAWTLDRNHPRALEALK